MRRLLITSVLTSVAFVTSPHAGASSTISLQIPLSTAAHILGHNCHGIQQQDFASTLDAEESAVFGAVYLQTNCSQGSKSHIFQTWVSARWSYSGGLEAIGPMYNPPSNINLAARHSDDYGNVLTDTLSGPAGCSVAAVNTCHYRASLQWSAIPKPTNLAVQQNGDSLVATWTSEDPSAGLNVVTVTTPHKVIRLTTPTEKIVIPGVVPGTRYSINVSTLPLGHQLSDHEGVSESATTSIVSQPATIIATPPSTVSSDGADSHLARITWSGGQSGNSRSDGQQIRFFSSASDPTPVSTVTVSGTSHTCHAPNPGSEWWVSIRTHNQAGWSPWSPRVHVSVPASSDH
ncbi:MAG: fibronectin type III domain-containing protein [Acidimicrobiaceae bacterium]|nr:fibronectin type III domain-containing protein [Acidimicrobiaceae bacterium]